MRTLTSPEPEAAAAFLKAELHRSLVQVVGLCEVHYQGRAQSTLSLGERLILLKPDGTLLVHTATKIKPVNWQPPGASFTAAVEEGRIVLTSRRGQPEEVVRITLHEAHAVMAVKLKDDEALQLLGSEADLGKLLIRHPDLVEAGFQVTSRERANGRGPMDLVGVDAQGTRVVVELKRRAAGLKEAEQLRRYVERERAAKGKVRGILLAPAVSDDARRYLVELGMEAKAVDWDKVVPLMQRVLPAGQKTLGAWAGTTPDPGTGTGTGTGLAKGAAPKARTKPQTKARAKAQAEAQTAAQAETEAEADTATDAAPAASAKPARARRAAAAGLKR